jgi:hypothetical protein
MTELDPVKLAAHARTAVNLSIHHLLAACRCAARVREVETSHANHPFAGFWEEILQNALGVTTLTAASLECFANELYFEGAAVASVLSSAAAEECLDLVDREPILRKYSLVLALRTQKRLDRGAPMVQNVDALLRLRNALVHFRPEWFGVQGNHEKLSKQLQYRFAPSPFLPGEPLFPRAWASHSFAEWAVRSTVSYLDYFYTEANVKNPIAQFRQRLVSVSGYAL